MSEPTPSAPAVGRLSPVAPWPALAAIAAVMLNVLAGLGVGVLAATDAVRGVDGTAGVVLRFVLLSAPYGLALGLVALMARVRRWSWTDAVGLRSFEPAAGLGLALGVALGGRVVATTWGMLVVLAGFEPPAELDVTRLFPSDAFGIAALVVIAVVVGPFVEEVVFRGVLYGALRIRVGAGWAMVFSGLAFGLVHVDLLWLVAPTAALGIALAWLVERTGSLWAPVLAHSAFNVTALVLAYAARGVGAV